VKREQIDAVNPVIPIARRERALKIFFSAKEGCELGLVTEVKYLYLLQSAEWRKDEYSAANTPGATAATA
jgi:hypothetical protein